MQCNEWCNSASTFRDVPLTALASRGDGAPSKDEEHMTAQHPPRRRPRRQPDPLRPLQHRLRHRLQPGDADRRDRRPGRPLRARGRAPRRGRRRRRAQAQPRLQPDPRVGARLEAGAGDPGHRHPAGVRHRPPGRDLRRQQDRPRPDRRRHRRRHRHHLRRADRDLREAAQEADQGQPARRTPTARLKALVATIRPGDIGLDDPAERRAAHEAVDGRARRPDRAGVADHPRGAGRAGRRVAPAPRRVVRRRASRTT